MTFFPPPILLSCTSPAALGPFAGTCCGYESTNLPIVLLLNVFHFSIHDLEHLVCAVQCLLYTVFLASEGHIHTPSALPNLQHDLLSDESFLQHAASRHLPSWLDTVS